MIGDVADVVVAGAGHNSLIAAAYLCRAGHRCLVLDARSVPGGGVASEELLLPGFLLDSCSTGHTLIQTNPLLVDDELGLIGEHGLSYIAPDPVAHVVFPDGESLTMWLDLERTCEELERFSAADARAYRRLLAEYDAVKDVFGRQRFTPVGWGPSFDEMLGERAGAARWRQRAAMSAFEVVCHEFGSRHVRAFMLWMAFQTGQPVGSAGSAPLAYSIIFGRQRRSWTIPRGGSGELARALVEDIEAHGGELRCDRRVSELIVDDGRCVGVVCASGERYRAREAVLSTIHVKDLVEMAPAELWDADFRYAIDTYDPGVSAFAAHYATTEPPRYATHDGGVIEAVSAGVAGWPEDILRMGRDVCEGRLVRDGAWLLFPTPTVADPTRAPAGHHTVKILGMQPYDPGGGPEQWASLRDVIAAEHLEHLRRAAPNLTDEKILAELIVSPVDLERSNPHMWHGTFHGGELRCDRRVSELIVDDGRCVGVVCAGGERYRAREAVLSTIHVKDLVEMAPAELWDADFRYAIDTYDPGVSAFAAHYATTEPPRYATHDGGLIEAVSAGVAGWPEDILRMGRDVCEGRLVRDGSWLLFPTPTVADPTRAPAGHHTVKILGMQPYDPGGGPEQWALLRDEIAAEHLEQLRRAAPNLTGEKILAELIVSPVDLERSNPHMWHGTFHGGDRSVAHSGALRPAAGWAQHRMPIPGLYQTGGTTHPGGSVTGAPGRNAAVVMLEDFGQDLREVVLGAKRIAGR